MGFAHACARKVDGRSSSVAGRKDASALRSDHSFPADCRLRRAEDFARLKGGCRLYGKGCRVIWRPNELAHGRLGMAVSRKLGNAVRRNRFRRIVREVFRQHPIRHTPVDVLVIASAPLDRRQCTLADELVRLFDHIVRSMEKRP